MGIGENVGCNVGENTGSSGRRAAVSSGPSYTPSHYVTVTGAGSHNGSLGNEWTLEEAMVDAVAGNNIEVADGTYVDSTATIFTEVFETTNSGSSGSPIVLYSKNWQGAIIDSPNQTVYPAIAHKNRSYITWDGFAIEGQFWMFGGTGNIIQNCVITEGYAQTNDLSLAAGIRCEEQNLGLVKNNHLSELTSAGTNTHNSAGILVIGDNYDTIIEYNTVDMRNCDMGGPLGTKGGATSPSDNIWRYNFCIGGTSSLHGMWLLGKGTGQFNGTVHNNIILDCDDGLHMDKTAPNGKLYNNTIYNCARSIWSVTGCDKNMDIFNNIFAEASIEHMWWTARAESDSTVCSSAAGEPWSTFLNYLQYNNYSGSVTRFASEGEANNPTYAALSNFVSAKTPLGTNSTDSTDPGFINAGGYNAVDYKRSSYPTDGRGSGWADVMGAYVTGNETIGYVDPRS